MGNNHGNCAVNTKNQKKTEEKNFWDKVAGERVYAAFSEKDYNLIIDENIRGKTRGAALDVGCASGVSAVILARKGFDVKGLDVSPNLIEQAKRLWKEEKHLEFIVGDAENLPFPDNSMDVCFFGGVIHHFPDYQKVLEETWRILKDGGVLLMVEPNALDIVERFSWFYAGKCNLLSPNEYPVSPYELKSRLDDKFEDFKIYPIRMDDIPFFSFLPFIGKYFRGGKGKAIKMIPLSILNMFRPKMHRGNFFVLSCVKKKADNSK